ncbi:hypothetical protein BDR07DRAFT_38326 [Suillus spraguei]|nr:hypothetical protein BDR07DRAFT_38326 [Suillus spraguei]
MNITVELLITVSSSSRSRRLSSVKSPQDLFFAVSLFWVKVGFLKSLTRPACSKETTNHPKCTPASYPSSQRSTTCSTTVGINQVVTLEENGLSHLCVLQSLICPNHSTRAPLCLYRTSASSLEPYLLFLSDSCSPTFHLSSEYGAWGPYVPYRETVLEIG